MPPKASYRDFEDDPALEYEFYLAEKVMHCTVDELRERMSQDEFTRWSVYHGRKAQRQEMALKRAKG